MRSEEYLKTGKLPKYLKPTYLNQVRRVINPDFLPPFKFKRLPQ